MQLRKSNPETLEAADVFKQGLFRTHSWITEIKSPHLQVPRSLSPCISKRRGFTRVRYWTTGFPQAIPPSARRGGQLPGLPGSASWGCAPRFPSAQDPSRRLGGWGESTSACRRSGGAAPPSTRYKSGLRSKPRAWSAPHPRVRLRPQPRGEQHQRRWTAPAAPRQRGPGSRFPRVSALAPAGAERRPDRGSAAAAAPRGRYRGRGQAAVLMAVAAQEAQDLALPPPGSGPVRRAERERRRIFYPPHPLPLHRRTALPLHF